MLGLSGQAHDTLESSNSVTEFRPTWVTSYQFMKQPMYLYLVDNQKANAGGATGSRADPDRRDSAGKKCFSGEIGGSLKKSEERERRGNDVTARGGK